MAKHVFFLISHSQIVIIDILFSPIYVILVSFFTSYKATENLNVFLEQLFHFPNMAKLLVLRVMHRGSRWPKYPAETWWLLHKICKQQPKVAIHLVTASVCILNASIFENKNKSPHSTEMGCFTDYHSVFFFLSYYHLRISVSAP